MKVKLRGRRAENTSWNGPNDTASAYFVWSSKRAENELLDDLRSLFYFIFIFPLVILKEIVCYWLVKLSVRNSVFIHSPDGLGFVRICKSCAKTLRLSKQ